MKTIEQALMEHQIKSKDIAKRLLKVGNEETSAIIEYGVKMEGDNIEFETTITLLPIRRIYKAGALIVDDNQLLHEILEDI